MSKAEEDFEQVLTRCREQLTEISLTVPDLDKEGGDLIPRFSLAESPPPVMARFPDEALVAASEPTLPPASVPRGAEREDPPSARIFVEPQPRAPLAPLPDRAPSPEPAAAAVPEASHAPARISAPHSGLTRRLLLLSALIAFSVAGLAAYRIARDRGASTFVSLAPPIYSFLSPSETGDLLVSRGNELLTIDNAGGIRRRLAIEGPFAAMRWSQGSLWSVDGKSASVSERRGDSRPTVYSLNHVPTSFFLNDRFLWTGERSSRTLRQFMLSRSILGAMLQPIDRIDLPSNVDPLTFAFEPNGDLYVVDANQHRILRLRIGGGAFRPYLSAPLSPILGPDPSLHRLFMERGALWSLSNPSGGSAELKRIPFSSLNWSPAE